MSVNRTIGPLVLDFRLKVLIFTVYFLNRTILYNADLSGTEKLSGVSVAESSCS